MIETESTRASVSRCPACGQRVDPPGATHCPLCNFDFGDDRVTGADVTPYAQAYAQGEPGWWTMCSWVWLASAERLKHLALMRSSAASRSFALRTSLLLALGLAVFQGTRVGWLRVPRAGPIMKPAGGGWFHVADMPHPNVPGFLADSFDLWWNPAQAMIGSVVAGLTGLLALVIVRHVVGLGIRLAHRREYRNEQRMSAALLYSTAWGVPALIGALLCLLRPLAFVGEVARWSWAIRDQTVVMLAVIGMALSTLIWWLWLIRLGATAPHATRTRVSGFLLVGAPLIAVAVVAGWWYSLEWLYETVFFRLNLHF